MASAMEPNPPAGVYPTGLAGLSREWDGHVWTDTITRDNSAQALPKWQRKPFAFLGHKWFLISIIGFFLGIAIAAFTVAANLGALRPVAAIGVLAVVFGFVMLMTQRVVGREVIRARTMLLWGLIGGAVGVGIGAGLEWLFDELLHLNPDGAVALLAPGPAEELGKLAVPIILYLTGRFRDPRAGFLLVLSTGAAFGVMEGIEYLTIAPDIIRDGSATGAADTEALKWAAVIMAVMRPFIELLHPVLVGFVGAVAWQAAWRKGHFFTWPAIGAFAIAVVLHSVNDTLAALIGSGQLVYFIVMVVIVYFVAMRRSASQLVPPQVLETTPPGWRPRVPKKLIPAE